MNIATKRVLGGVAAGVLLVGASACSTTAKPENVTLQYDVGVNGGKKFKECIQPNTKGDGTVNNENVDLTIEKRTWNITHPNEGGDATEPIVSDTMPTRIEGQSDTFGPKVNVYVKTEFYLNTDCGAKDAKGDFKDGSAPIVQWWERTGRRYGAAEGGDGVGWRNMLLQTLVPAQRKAVSIASRAFTADDVNTGANNTWAKMEAMAQGLFLAELNAANGGANYFCGPQFKRNPDGSVATVEWDEPILDPSAPGGIRIEKKSGTCPPVRISIQDAELHDPSIEAARVSNYVEQQTAKAAKTKADSAAQVAGILKNAGAGATELQRQQVELQMEQERTKQIQACAQAAKAVCVVGGGGAGVNVNAG